MSIMIIAPHPDDEVLGCGGVMARYAAAGDHVHVLVVTRGDPDLFPSQIVDDTRRQLEAAHAVLGVKSVRFLDFPAPKLDSVPGHELADAIGEVLREIEPAVLFLPHFGDIHTDHRHVYEATMVAVRPIDGCTVRRILCYETLSETEWSTPLAVNAFLPTVFVDITSTLATKLQAFSCYRAQMKAAPHPRSLEGIEVLARLRGHTVGVAAAEAFALVRAIVPEA